MKENLVSQDYWDNSYNRMQLTDDETPNVITEWIRQHIPETAGGRCFEIGCFPGRFLTTFGKLGYELNGLDLTPRVEAEFPAWLKQQGYKTGKFVRRDFLSFEKNSQYTVVCSFGFIEHFPNWKAIFEKHLEMVEPGGYLVIETPNFRGWLQRAIHFFLDRENYKRHYVPAMAPSEWKDICERHGFRVLSHGYLGRFQFWVDKEPQSFIKKKLFHKLLQYTPRLQQLKEGGKPYAPYCGIIAQRPLNNQT